MRHLLAFGPVSNPRTRGSTRTCSTQCHSHSGRACSSHSALCTPSSRSEESLVRWGSTYRTSSTSRISQPPCNSCRTTSTMWRPRSDQWTGRWSITWYVRCSMAGESPMTGTGDFSTRTDRSGSRAASSAPSLSSTRDTRSPWVTTSRSSGATLRTWRITTTRRSSASTSMPTSRTARCRRVTCSPRSLTHSPRRVAAQGA
mmetsp:Transcript_2704/g.7752  ORF Transcript_2704/g.7752 Transcript_2704/m.7752 type:complete len:201 (-) Transcript_2704:1172-1774(-)